MSSASDKDDALLPLVERLTRFELWILDSDDLEDTNNFSGAVITGDGPFGD